VASFLHVSLRRKKRVPLYVYEKVYILTRNPLRRHTQERDGWSFEIYTIFANASDFSLVKAWAIGRRRNGFEPCAGGRWGLAGYVKKLL
jgi:hypothetical protein